jgi:MtN3 and saliva related transmembrane protein
MQNELLGYMAGGLITISVFPQVIKTYKTKSVNDLSLLWTILMAVGLLLWIIYAVINRLLSLEISGISEFLLTVLLVVMQVKYRK